MSKSKGLPRYLSFFLAFVMLLSTVSCSGEKSQTETAAQVGTPVETSTFVEILTVEDSETEPLSTETKEDIPPFVNPLTGLACTEEVSKNRPLAVMLNNIKDALPQAGLSGCDIIYEVLAEGGIIRLEGLFQDYQNVPKIGSVRSARPYYVQIASAYDALFAHVGGSEDGKSEIKRLGVNNLDGLIYDGSVIEGVPAFYRDQDRLNSGYAYEHTMFTSGAGVSKIVASRGYRSVREDIGFSAFCFDRNFKGLTGSAASYIKIPHSNYSVSEFYYSADDGLYYHNQYGEAHVDSNNNARVATENVFILFADQKVIDSYGRLSTNLIGEGTGYYITGGTATPIVWKRPTDGGTFSYYNPDGTELKVKCGKSFVSIADNDIANLITIS